MMFMPFCTEIVFSEENQLQPQVPMTVVSERAAYEALIQSFRIPYTPLPPGSTRFYFVRHGESIANKERTYAGQTLDVDLTEKGEGDAFQVGQRLQTLQAAQGWIFDVLFSSPFKRAQRTTEIAASQFVSYAKELCTDTRLREKHHGMFDGKLMGDDFLQRMLQGEAQLEKLETFSEKFNFKHDPLHPHEESLQQVFNRIEEFLLEKSHECNGKTLFVGSHGGVLKTLLVAHAATTGCILDYHRFEALNGDVLVLEVDENGKTQVVDVHGFKFRETSKISKPS